MEPVSLKEFVATGAFGPIALGRSSELLERTFGPPEDLGGTSRKQRRPTIWKYGDVEFYFPRGNGLEMIHIDRFSGLRGIPGGCGDLSVDPWIIREGLPLGEFLVAVAESGLCCTLRSDPHGQTIAEFPGGVGVGFAVKPDEFSDFVGLAWVTCHARRT